MGQSKLTLPILHAYAAFGVQFEWCDSKDVYGIHFENETDYTNNLYPFSNLLYTLKQKALDPDYDIGWKLLLRPLSALTTEIEYNGERFVPMYL